MATNEILQFAGSATGAEILDQAAYASDADRTDGHDPGSIARAELENKVLLQTSTIAAAVAQFMADAQANNITDATAIATLASYLKTSIKNVSLLFTIAGGTVDAITAAFTPATTALADGKFMVVRATGANTVANPTLAVDGLTAKTIVKGNDSALSIGDIPGAGFYMLLTYNPALDKYVLNNPVAAAGSSGGFIHIREARATGVDAGSFTSGSWINRTLNTIVTNTIPGVSWVADVPTGRVMPILPDGTYKVTWSSPAHNVNRHQTRLYDNTNLVALLVGSTENTTGSVSTEVASTTRSIYKGLLTTSGNGELILQHKCSNTQNTTGLGSSANTGEPEYYADLFIEQVL